MTKAEPRVAALERGIKILTCFLGPRSQLTLTEIAEMTGFYKSTALRLCGTLQQTGFLHRDGDGVYSLGPLVGELGAKFDPGTFVDRDVIHGEMEKLHGTFGETIAFYIPLGAEQMCLFRIESNKVVRAAIQEGQRLPIGKEASGLVLDAAAGKPGAAYDAARKEGAAVSLGAVHAGATGVAVPVLRPSGEVVGAITIIGPSERLDAKTIERMKTALKASARKAEAASRTGKG